MEPTAHVALPHATSPTPNEALASHRATVEELVRRFWAAPMEALFRQNVVAAVVCKSEAWAERKRWEGGGPPYIKAGRSVLYSKGDVVAWLSAQRRFEGTSEQQEVAA